MNRFMPGKTLGNVFADFGELFFDLVEKLFFTRVFRSPCAEFIQNLFSLLIVLRAHERADQASVAFADGPVEQGIEVFNRREGAEFLEVVAGEVDRAQDDFIITIDGQNLLEERDQLVHDAFGAAELKGQVAPGSVDHLGIQARGALHDLIRGGLKLFTVGLQQANVVAAFIEFVPERAENFVEYTLFLAVYILVVLHTVEYMREVFQRTQVKFEQAIDCLMRDLAVLLELLEQILHQFLGLIEALDETDALVIAPTRAGIVFHVDHGSCSICC